MLDRRQFLGGTILLLGCSAKVIPQTNADGNNSTGIPGCNGIVATSSLDASHLHLVCVPNADIANPAVDGVTYTTTDDDQHTHTVTLTQDLLVSIQTGALVTITTSNELDPVNGFTHTHQVSIVKM